MKLAIARLFYDSCFSSRNYVGKDSILNHRTKRTNQRLSTPKYEWIVENVVQHAAQLVSEIKVELYSKTIPISCYFFTIFPTSRLRCFLKNGKESVDVPAPYLAHPLQCLHFSLAMLHLLLNQLSASDCGRTAVEGRCWILYGRVSQHQDGAYNGRVLLFLKDGYY